MANLVAFIAMEMSRITISTGRIPITAGKFMALGEVEVESLPMDYDLLIRISPAAEGIRRFVNLNWDRNSNQGSRKFTFDLAVSADSISQILSDYTLQLPESIEIDILGPPSPETPSLKRTRMSKVDQYLPATLVRYSKLIEKAVMTSITEVIPSGNATFQNQELNDVVFRERKSINSADSVSSNINNIIVSSIKDLLVSMAKYGRNDRANQI